MTDQNLLARITSRPGVLAGKPTVRGTRLSVEFILNLLAHGVTQAEILSDYEGLALEDLTACLLFTRKSRVNTTDCAELKTMSQTADENCGHVPPRQGWDEQFQRMARLGDDRLFSDMEALPATDWDEKEWKW